MADAAAPTAIDLETVLADYGQQIANYARDLAMSRAHAAALAAEVAELRQRALSSQEAAVAEVAKLREAAAAQAGADIDLSRLDPAKRRVTDSPQA